MNIKLLLITILLVPCALEAITIEEEAGNLLGTSYTSEAAQAFFKAHQLTPDFPERTAFTYNFYEQGVSIKINGGEYIQAIQIYNQTMLFKTFAKKVYGKQLSEVYGDNDIYKVIKMAPIAEDEASGTIIYPNKKPADYLVRVMRKADNTLRSIAWLLDDNAMEKIIAESANTMLDNGIDSHDAVWALLGIDKNSALTNKLLKGSFTIFKDRIGNPICDKANGIYLAGKYISSPERQWSYRYIEFKRRGQFGTKAGFPHALPAGLFWWSTPADFEKEFTLKESRSEVGAYLFEKETDMGTMSAVFSMGILSHVRFIAKKVK